jgi:hypothetical protein
MPDGPIEDLLSRATQILRALIDAAFEAGRAKEREDMKRELATFLSRGDTALMTGDGWPRNSQWRPRNEWNGQACDQGAN